MSVRSRQRSALSIQLVNHVQTSARAWYVVALSLLLIPATSATAGGRECSLRAAALAAVSPDPALHAPAIAALRDAGPDGLEALLDTHAQFLESGRDALAQGESCRTDPRWLRLTAALDAVARARDTYAAGLYWYTEWEKAVAAAKATGRPILSLRLLGNLDDEFSCANSRFFRTALYANAEISRYLRDHYVLHWKSVRPVPRVSIDFGDGRKLERTLTGNSIHYVLDADGRVIDALPGLYGPSKFLGILKAAERKSGDLHQASPAERERILCDYHEQAETWARSIWNYYLVGRGIQVSTAVTTGDPGAKPDALKAARIAVGKRAVEFSVLRELLPPGPDLEQAMTANAWQDLAQSHREEARLDQASLRFMREKSTLARHASTAGGATAAGCVSEMADRFEDLMALDTVRNDYLYRRAIHEWLAVGGYSPGVDELNARVYAELFLTPDSDPWLGLLPVDVYTALDDDGVQSGSMRR